MFLFVIISVEDDSALILCSSQTPTQNNQDEKGIYDPKLSVYFALASVHGTSLFCLVVKCRQVFNKLEVQNPHFHSFNQMH